MKDSKSYYVIKLGEYWLKSINETGYDKFYDLSSNIASALLISDKNYLEYIINYLKKYASSSFSRLKIYTISISEPKLIDTIFIDTFIDI